MAARNRRSSSKPDHGSYTASIGSSGRIENNPGSILPSRSSIMEPRTPTRIGKISKKVRFSDPGLPIQQLSSNLDSNLSTGLTPAIKRTRLVSQNSPSIKEPSAKRTRRRYSEPNWQTDNNGVKYELPELPTEAQTFQFLSCSAILNARARRRIARFGLSEEMNNINERKKEKEREERAKEEELANLRRELSTLRKVKTEAQDDSAPYTPERIRELSEARHRIAELETLLRKYEDSARAENLSISQPANEDEEMIFVGDDITMMDNDMLTASSSPVSSRLSSNRRRTSDAWTQISRQDTEQDAENNALSAQLHNVRQEKRALFRDWSSLLGSNNMDRGNGSQAESPPNRSASPPPNFLPQIVTTLRKILSRESKAIGKLESVAKDLSGHGFDGASASEILSNMGVRFRQARIELERAVPGETANGDLMNWKEIIDALVERINNLVQDLALIHEQVAGCEHREAALRNQFNMTLHRLEQSNKKNKNLEEVSDSMAEDMMHIRMKMQKLGQDINVLETDKVRLNNAIANYRADLKILEELNMKLEDDTIASMQKVAELENANSNLHSENMRAKEDIAKLEQNIRDQQRIREKMQKHLDKRTAELSSLESKIQQLKSDHDQAIASQSQNHDKQLGAMNVRISLITNALNETQSEIETLRVDKARLQSRLNSLQKLFSQETIHTARERASATVRELMEWENGMSALYGGIDSPNDHQSGQNDSEVRNTINDSGFAPIGSEPITPSCDRFVNVEVYRGDKRKRRRPDSGIEILKEEEEEEEEEGEEEGEGGDALEDSGIGNRG
ncbi:hypothetical protein PAAG_06390 [Paracoccidioides lutzii Pb01]|uniref:Uncharacterized protein n=1 Tax=Paracoccidioides lutzii (strain ATCC MYA-826 / Pb01) TaxID=502779 RepID=C1H6J9_PARBA|nr:hypothetical protein PAAG_06390 [Paracoccidioides lutzii Pb01]EEH35343.1 hypothetical protein PAAG_06390 [Paracoccidioides lutzii Pb01]